MKDRYVELRDRALRILGVNSVHDSAEMKQNFRRQIRLVNPNGPQRNSHTVPGFRNGEMARLLIQAYCFLNRGNCPTTMLEDDALVGTLLGGSITPMSRTRTPEGWNATQFYDQFRHSIWPQADQPESAARNRFGGIC